MNMTQLVRLLPTMEIIEEAFSLAGWKVHASIRDAAQVYRNVRLYTGHQPLLKDVLYTLRPGETAFPTDDYAYICTTPLEGKADHICCPDVKAELLLDFLLELYSRFQHNEMRIDQLTYRGASLEELCQLGEELLENPVCIHDDWFILIGLSRQALPLMAPEQVMSSSRGFLPRVILEDFQHDSDYLETYSQTQPQIWDGSGYSPSSLYMNLWDETIFRGRLVVIRQNRDFRKSDYRVVEVLTQRAIFLIQRLRPGQMPGVKNMDDIVYSLLTGSGTDIADQTHLLRLLHWDRRDSCLCIRLRSQQPESQTILDHVLHSDLFRVFPESYILLTHQEQCLILNLNRSDVPYSHIPHRLAPLCRDYALYAGFSSPVSGIQEWNLAYHQAGAALDHAFRKRNDRWIVPFSQCAMEYLLRNLPSPLTPANLVAPELEVLREHDREKGTQYFETFRTYLLQERDIPRTAKALIIHRTTLLYRLEKIHALIHTDLEDPWQRMYITLSLWILEKARSPENS